MPPVEEIERKESEFGIDKTMCITGNKTNVPEGLSNLPIGCSVNFTEKLHVKTKQRILFIFFDPRRNPGLPR